MFVPAFPQIYLRHTLLDLNKQHKAKIISGTVSGGTVTGSSSYLYAMHLQAKEKVCPPKQQNPLNSEPLT